VLLEPDTAVSLRSIKAALIRFPLERAAVLLPSLAHSNGRVRFAAVDIIREMADLRAAASPGFVLDSKTFEPELAEIFLGRLCSDENLDVRARAAGVIAHMDDRRATPALLELLKDAQWPVRLHAVRALSQPRYVREAAAIARRLTDSHWMVREAAVGTLLTFGQDGLDHLLETFLTGHDRYCQEQIAEAIHRAGLIPHIFKQRRRPVEGQAVQPAEHLARLSRAIARASADLQRLDPMPGGAASPSQEISLESFKTSLEKT
jgi:HEAT repeat protein